MPASNSLSERYSYLAYFFVTYTYIICKMVNMMSLLENTKVRNGICGLISLFVITIGINYQNRCKIILELCQLCDIEDTLRYSLRVDTMNNMLLKVNRGVLAMFLKPKWIDSG